MQKGKIKKKKIKTFKVLFIFYYYNIALENLKKNFGVSRVQHMELHISKME